MVRRRRRRRSQPALWLLTALLLGVVIYVVFPLFVGGAAEAQGVVRAAGMSASEIIRERLLYAAGALWVFFFGASFGSFLNVVVHRMPARESIAWNPSRCPFCRVPIRAVDNIPVFAWLSLRGRCRACRLPISPRYPIIEALCGVGFVVLASFEVAAGGANLPNFDPEPRALALVFAAPPWQLLVICLFHGALLFALLGWALMNYDSAVPPWSYIGWWILVGLVISVVAPFVQLAPWTAPSPQAGDWRRYIQLLETPLAGAALGLACGFCLTCWRPMSLGDGLPFVVVGVYLGWQATLSIGVITLLLVILLHWTPLRFIHRLAGVCFLATGIQLLGWRWLAEVPWWPGGSMEASLAGCAILMTWMMAAAVPRRIAAADPQ